MEFYNEKDLEYWKRQADAGKAVLLEIPVSMLLDLDIRSLSEDASRPPDMEDLEKWIDKNRAQIEAELEKERKEKEALAKMEETLYDKADGVREEKPAGEMKKALSAAPAIPSLSDEEARQRVSRILEKEPFDEDQIMVIAEAMMEELPDRYILCFLKKEYSADVMRTVKGYCTKAYKEASGL